MKGIGARSVLLACSASGQTAGAHHDLQHSKGEEEWVKARRNNKPMVSQLHHESWLESFRLILVWFSYAVLLSISLHAKKKQSRMKVCFSSVWRFYGTVQGVSLANQWISLHSASGKYKRKSILLLCACAVFVCLLFLGVDRCCMRF